jgi:hypothetical protein
LLCAYIEAEVDVHVNSITIDDLREGGYTIDKCAGFNTV